MRHTRIDPGRNAYVDPRPEQPVRVADCMSRGAITIRSDATAETAWNLMKTRQIRHLPVVDADDRLVGIVTDRDLRQVPFVPVSSGRALPGGLPVERIMTAAVISVQLEADIFEAARLMHEQKIGALPVVKNGRLVGILTETDLLMALATMPRRA
jgi:acetoin utilization protein AcuB